MSITEETAYQSTTLRGAPVRTTRAEAEADEARGIEVEAYLALLPTLTDKQWNAARDVAWGAAWNAARDVALDATWDATWNAARAAMALVVRDRITEDQFNTLTAPMRAAGIDFDNLTGANDERH